MKAKNVEQRGLHLIEGGQSQEHQENLPPVRLRSRFSGYLQSALVISTIMGIIGVTSLLAVAHYKGSKATQTTAISSLVP